MCRPRPTRLPMPVIKAMQLISQNLRQAVSDGKDLTARENMAYAQFLAGMAFNNASLGFVHAMAHQLGGFYDLPHGVCNAVLLPHVQTFNAHVCAARLTDVAHALGADIRLSPKREYSHCGNSHLGQGC